MGVGEYPRAQRPYSQSQRSCGLCGRRIDINEALSVVSVLFNAPRKSSSRSVRQLMKEMELSMRSVVNLMFAVFYVYSKLLANRRAGTLVVGCGGESAGR